MIYLLCLFRQHRLWFGSTIRTFATKYGDQGIRGSKTHLLRFSANGEINFISLCMCEDVRSCESRKYMLSI